MRMDALYQEAQTAYVAIVLFIAVPLSIVIGALFLKLAAKLVTKHRVPFGRACLAVFVVMAITGPTGYLIRLAFKASDGHPALAGLLSLPINFFIGAWVYGAMIKRPRSRRSIGFGKGMLISLVLMLIGVMIGLVLQFVGFALFHAFQPK